MKGPTPTALKLHKASRTLELEYETAGSFTLTAEYLRVYSPSAEVRGHSPEEAKLQINKIDVGIDKIEPVGNYAIKLFFDDGHNTGIYPWTYLYELCANQEQNWQDYLKRLDEAGASRDGSQVVQIMPAQPK
ncbi:MAG: DUF971 domain-containing protein [Pseudomonadales bacterium]|jgi:DUF971 family protein